MEEGIQNENYVEEESNTKKNPMKKYLPYFLVNVVIMFLVGIIITFTRLISRLFRGLDSIPIEVLAVLSLFFLIYFQFFKTLYFKRFRKYSIIMIILYSLFLVFVYVIYFLGHFTLINANGIYLAYFLWIVIQSILNYIIFLVLMVYTIIQDIVLIYLDHKYDD
jgi:hypothetical protein